MIRELLALGALLFLVVLSVGFWRKNERLQAIGVIGLIVCLCWFPAWSSARE